MSRISINLSLSILLLFMGLAQAIPAQSTEAAIRARLLDKRVYLRGVWGDAQLRFNADGTLAIPSSPLSFTVAGFRLKSVRVKKNNLTLKGKRMGLEFTKSGQKWVDVENLEVEIARPSSGDFGPALDAIFTEDFSSFAPSLPSYWQRFAQCNLFPAADPGKVPLFCQPGIKPDKSAKQVGGSVSAPQLGEHAEAEFNRFARRVKYTGTSVVGMIVDETGQPSRLRVVTPAGLGLDEQALAAVERWHFTPALQNGNPVKVEVNVEVNFKIY